MSEKRDLWFLRAAALGVVAAGFNAIFMPAIADRHGWELALAILSRMLNSFGVGILLGVAFLAPRFKRQLPITTAQSYRIGVERTGGEGAHYIECLVCNSRSFHPKDIEQKYCGRCHQFHPITKAPAFPTSSTARRGQKSWRC